MKFLSLFLIVAFAAFSIGCGDGQTTANIAPDIKKGVAPVADNEIAVIEMEEPAYGTMKIELYSNIAPKMVERFKTLAKEGAYDGLIFHRVNNTVIQAGDMSTKGNDGSKRTEKGSGKGTVQAEFSDIPYDVGIVGAARTQDINTADSQFFITLKREPGFDNKYTIFGKVIEGINNAQTISGVNPKNGEMPVEPVRIKSIKIVSK